MKKALFFTFMLAFTASMSAQIPSVSTSDLKKEGVKAATKDQPKMESQIKQALMKDEGLQKETISYLKSNPDTTESLANLVTKGKGSNKDLMQTILGDSDLTSAAIDYISKNPELLSKAMKVIGL